MGDGSGGGPANLASLSTEKEHHIIQPEEGRAMANESSLSLFVSLSLPFMLQGMCTRELVRAMYLTFFSLCASNSP